ncbi:DUF805 domain-containing protein [Companilactobacillus sp. DQM5]|uniref:DUF805 domain-containing protein n=1 Tax=Companilactobacillus sp. DQM5 TaxID=3463359 RepID=UPI0040590497
MITATVNMILGTFKFNGKLNRIQFWLGSLGYVILVLIFSGCIIYFIDNTNSLILKVLGSIFFILAKFSLSVAEAKRINDAGYPWYLIFLKIFPVLGQIAVFILLCLPSSEVRLSK